MKNPARPGLRRSSSTRTAIAAVFGLAATAAACDRLLYPSDDRVCQQTYEFGNYGCVVIVAMVEAPAEKPAGGIIWDVRSRAADPAAFLEVFTPDPGPGANRMKIIRYKAPVAGAGDSLSLWISARMLNDPRPVQVGVPLTVFAADSVMRVVRFRGVGQRAEVDTVRLVLVRRQ
jgi:hypothetical protein